jgi:hypothetical protein
MAELMGREVQVLKREVEKPKYRVKQIIRMMRDEGFVKFNQHHHTIFWRVMDGRNPAKGYGVDVAGEWFWYESWVEKVWEHCAASQGLYV